jgi:hypothetical protein
MLYRILLFLWSFLLDVVVISRLTDEEKDLEVLPTGSVDNSRQVV